MHPGGQYLYVANAGSGDVYSYSVDAASGIPTKSGAVSLALTGARPSELVVDPLGEFVYVIDSRHQTKTILSVNPGNGTLSILTTETYVQPIGSIFVDPRGRFFLWSYDQENVLRSLPIDRATGKTEELVPNQVVTPPVAGFVRLAFNPALPGCLYATFGSDRINQYAMDSAGVLTEVATLQNLGSALAKIAVDPAGAFAYVVDAATGGVLELSCDGATGALTPLGQVNTPSAVDVVIAAP